MPFSMNKIKHVAVFLLIFVSTVEVYRIDESHAVGFLSDCPRSWKPAEISPKTLKLLKISHMGPGAVTDAAWTSYNYYQIEKLAKHPGIDFRRKTFLYVGGYMDFTALPIGRTIGEIYGRMDYNVLLLDTIPFTAMTYSLAARMIRSVGKYVADMLARLTKLGLDPKKLEIVGLSLGGQTMSFIAKHYRHLTGRNISTLVGLDPAGPCFRHLGPDQRLDPSDADFVLSIATNIDGYGMALPIGHVTFYVNGGEYQPGDLPQLPCLIECSHIRVISLYISALMHPGKLIGIQCDSVQQARDANCYDRRPMVTNTLDLYTDRSKPGIYFLPTTAKHPYAVGRFGLKKKARNVLKHLKELGVKTI